MVLVVEKKFLEEDWWKYALATFLLLVGFWVLLGYRISPTFSLGPALLESYALLFIFLALAYLPFIAGRLQFRKLFWFGFIGFILGALAYFSLSIMGVGVRFELLPFIAFLQIFVSCFSIGLLIEFGKYVFRKLVE